MRARVRFLHLLILQVPAVEHDEYDEADDRQAFQHGCQYARLVVRNEHDEVDGDRFEERYQLRTRALYLRHAFLKIETVTEFYFKSEHHFESKGRSLFIKRMGNLFSVPNTIFINQLLI